NVFLWAEGQMEGENLSKEEFTLLSVIKDLESELKDRLDKKGISLAYETAKEITLYSDAGIVRILLRNLIVNAIKYSHPNSSIEINCIRGNQTNVLEVIDTGIGMAEETVNGLFTGEIDSTDGTAGEKGNGLGLALCYDFVRRLGGTIAVESTLGKGSVFRVTIKD
ncbi:MAG: HAMP domain-containing histidine kinase, partial [Ekhidna sp.]|nr:HAMP domain-containing histidine kinase [Ekhidna sp.]